MKEISKKKKIRVSFYHLVEVEPELERTPVEGLETVEIVEIRHAALTRLRVQGIFAVVELSAFFVVCENLKL